MKKKYLNFYLKFWSSAGNYEMWICNKNVRSTDLVRNDIVLENIGKNENYWNIPSKERKANWMEYVLQWNCFIGHAVCLLHPVHVIEWCWLLSVIKGDRLWVSGQQRKITNIVMTLTPLHFSLSRVDFLRKK